jgi:hypothetical protein
MAFSASDIAFGNVMPVALFSVRNDMARAGDRLEFDKGSFDMTTS